MGRHDGAKIADKICAKCNESYKYEKTHKCKTQTVHPVQTAQQPKPDNIEFTNSNRTLADIERELNTAEVKENKSPVDSKHTTGAQSTATVNPDEIILFKDLYGAMSDTLNKHWNCTDFPTDENRLSRLERMTVKTLEYYKVHFNAPLALFLTVGIIYGIPVLKHIGFLDLIAKRLKKHKEGAEPENKNPVEKSAESKFTFPKIPQDKELCEKCKGQNMLICFSNEKAVLQCTKCNNVRELV